MAAKQAHTANPITHLPLTYIDPSLPEGVIVRPPSPILAPYHVRLSLAILKKSQESPSRLQITVTTLTDKDNVVSITTDRTVVVPLACSAFAHRPRRASIPI
jgi:hypothetical protein